MMYPHRVSSARAPSSGEGRKREDGRSTLIEYKYKSDHQKRRLGTQRCDATSRSCERCLFKSQEGGEIRNRSSIDGAKNA